jgi:hypothetical protein
LNLDTNISNIFKFNLIVIGKEYIQITSVNKSNIDFGNVEQLDFVLSNFGTSPLQNIIFSWSDPTDTILPVNSDNTKYIRYLDINSSVIVSYNVMANTSATPGLYKLDLDINFENSNSENASVSTIVGMFVGGQTDFDVTFSESSSGNVSLSIANVGNNPAASVNIIIPEQDFYQIKGSNSAIIGNLDIGDYTIISFPITSKTRSAGSNNLKVTIEYTDSVGNRNSITKEIKLLLTGSGVDTNTNSTDNPFGGEFPRQSTNKTSKIYLYLLIGVGVLGVGYIIYRHMIKKKKTDKK